MSDTHGETETNPTTATETPAESKAPSVEQLQKELADLRGLVEGRTSTLVEDVARLRKRIKAEPGEPASKPEAKAESAEGQPSAPAGVSREEMDAALRLGRVAASLPEGAQKRLDKMIEDGASYSKALEIAEVISEFGHQKPEAGSASQPKPTGRAASAASPSPSDGSRPRGLGELVELAKENRQAFDRAFRD